MNFENNIKKYIDAVNKKLECYLSPKYPEDIYKAMGYSVFAGGKRVRPVLMLAACEAFGGNIEDVLPSMDNDDYRRGKLTCHKAFNEGLAILAGDGLLTYAFDVMLSDALEKRDFKYVYATKTIAKLSGMNGMLVGQVVDVESEGKKIDADTLLYIHDNKTAGLIKAALLAGAAIGGADEDSLKNLEKIGYNIGVAFQIKDDILDVTSTTESDLCFSLRLRKISKGF